MSQAWLGRLLRNVRAGDDKLLDASPKLAAIPLDIELHTPEWTEGGAIPRRFAGVGVGDNRSPPLAWRNVPAATAELVLVVEDADVPLPRPFVHLSAYALPPDVRGFAEGALTPESSPTILFGRNTAGPPGYAGPRALAGHGPHAYHFQLFALSGPSGLQAGEPISSVRSRVEALAIARGRLIGTYEQTA